MRSEDIQLIRDTVHTTIKEVVNGKIDKLSDKLDEHIRVMEPVKDALSWVNTTQKFVKWTGIPVVAFIGFFYWLLK